MCETESNTMSVNELIAADEQLGYAGDELRQFVREQQAAARDAREAEREAEREAREAEAAARRQELELQLQIEQARQANAGADPGVGRAAGPAQVKAPLPKLPRSDESEDQMDAFIERFERFATCQELSLIHI